MTVTEHIREHLLKTCGVIRTPTYVALVESEWSPTFELAMRNRLILGALRYGCLNAPGKKKYDRVGRIQQEALLFLEDRNKERLVDIANMALLEFEEGIGTFIPKDDGPHTKELDKQE